jgi:hypothetical protein
VLAIAIDDHSRQTVALAPDDAAQPRIYFPPFPVCHGLPDPALEKIEIKILPPPRKTPGYDLRFAVVDRAAQQPILAILQGNHVAISRISERLQHLAGKNPVVPVQNSRARFDDDSSHGLMMSQLCRPLHNRLLIFPESKNCAAERSAKSSTSVRRCSLS